MKNQYYTFSKTKLLCIVIVVSFLNDLLRRLSLEIFSVVQKLYKVYLFHDIKYIISIILVRRNSIKGPKKLTTIDELTSYILSYFGRPIIFLNQITTKWYISSILTCFLGLNTRTSQIYIQRKHYVQMLIREKPNTPLKVHMPQIKKLICYSIQLIRISRVT